MQNFISIIIKEPPMEHSGNKEIDQWIETILTLPELSPIVKTLLEIWKTIHREASSLSGTSMVLSEEELGRLSRWRENFVSRFPEDVAIEQDPYDRATFCSVRLRGATEGASLIFPWNIYIDARYGLDTPLLREVTQNLTRFSSLRQLPPFIDYIVRARLKVPVNLTYLTVRILQQLTDLGFALTRHGFPTNQDIAQSIGCSTRSIDNIVGRLRQLGALVPRYMVNMSHLGFIGILCYHEESLKSPLFEFSLRAERLCPHRRVSILYLPAESELWDNIPSDSAMTLQKYYISWNLAQLSEKPQMLWSSPMRLLGEHDSVVPPPTVGVSFPLELNARPKTRRIFDLQLIDQLQLFATGRYEALANKMGITTGYLRKRVEFLLHEGIITPHFNINRIGLSTTVKLVWKFPASQSRSFLHNLLAFPYAEIFSGEEGGFATLKLPDTWVRPLLEDISRLQVEEQFVWATTAIPYRVRWGLPLSRLAKRYDEFFEWEWVMDPAVTIEP